MYAIRSYYVDGDLCIGWSELEFGDPPMGVAHGRLHPSEHYDSSLHAVAGADLRVRPVASNEYFQPAGGVYIESYNFV